MILIISIDEKSRKNILVYNVSYKTLSAFKPFIIRFNKRNGFIRVDDGTRYLVFFGSENMITFTTGSDIL